MIGFDKLKGIIPDSVIAQLPDTCSKFDINTDLRLCHFLSQCGHESASFTVVKENLNYSAQGLMAVFPKYFPDEATANKYARQPVKIANKVYANRMGNGDELSGDGWNYRGKGFIQTTGKNNYKSFGDFIGEDVITYPDLVATKYPLESAAYFFQKNNIWVVCDLGSDVKTITAVTKRVNGGQNGLADRITRFDKLYKLTDNA